MRLLFTVLGNILGGLFILAGIFVTGCLADYWLEYTVGNHVWWGVIPVGAGLWLAGIPVVVACGLLVAMPAAFFIRWTSDDGGAR